MLCCGMPSHGRGGDLKHLRDLHCVVCHPVPFYISTDHVQESTRLSHKLTRICSTSIEVSSFVIHTVKNVYTYMYMYFYLNIYIYIFINLYGMNVCECEALCMQHEP